MILFISITAFINFSFAGILLLLLSLNAQVAKLVDALCSGRSVRKDVLVRIQSWAHRLKPALVAGFNFYPNGKIEL